MMKNLLLLIGFLSPLTYSFGQESSADLSHLTPPLQADYWIPMPSLGPDGDAMADTDSFFETILSEVYPPSEELQPIEAKLGLSKGITYMAKKGTPVFAVADGRYSSLRSTGFQEGWCLQLRHSGGLRSEYISLDHLQVVEGQRVEKGDLLGYTSENQFHFRMKHRKEVIDPPPHFYQKDKIVVKAF